MDLEDQTCCGGGGGVFGLDGNRRFTLYLIAVAFAKSRRAQLRPYDDGSMIGPQGVETNRTGRQLSPVITKRFSIGRLFQFEVSHKIPRSLFGWYAFYAGVNFSRVTPAQLVEIIQQMPDAEREKFDALYEAFNASKVPATTGEKVGVPPAKPADEIIKACLRFLARPIRFA